MRKLLMSLMLALFGIGSLAYGIYTLVFENRGYKPTTAIIERIDEELTGYDADNIPEYSYTVYVRYEVDNNVYQNTINYYEEGYEEGKEIKIYYNPNDINNIHADSKNMGIYLVIIGPILILLAIFVLLRR